MNSIETLAQKAKQLNNLSNNEDALFEHINTNLANLAEVIQQYVPERVFKPVNTLRFLIAKELEKGRVVNKFVIEELKQAIENRDVSAYYELNDIVKQSLTNYKESKTGMFPNWKHAFKVLFPFIQNTSENDNEIELLNKLVDEIIEFNQLENVTKHIVGFQGAQNYGSDNVWVAIIPKSSPSVQYAYQIFFNISKNGLVGGIHKGHGLVKEEYDNQDNYFSNWGDYVENTSQFKEEWSQLNSGINFIFLNDEKEFVKRTKKTEDAALSTFFNTLDRLIEDLLIQDNEALVFSTANNQLSFQVGKRFCLNLKKKEFQFIAPDSYNIDELSKEEFSAPDNAYLYRNAASFQVIMHYDAIKEAIESELERESHTEPKSYDNSAFRKAAFDKEYRLKLVKPYINIEVSDKIKSSKYTHEQMEIMFKEHLRKVIPRSARNYLSAISTINRIGIKANALKETLYEIQDIKSHKLLISNLKNDEDYIERNKVGHNMFSATLKNYKDFLSTLRQPMIKQNIYSTQFSLNQILYGPPGTGKTYNTILEAAKIIEQDESIKYDSALNVFNAHLGEQIEFITFHQNYSYEDFIQGLRPETENNNELTFYKKDGVFKRIADRALRNIKDANKIIQKKLPFSEVFDNFINPLTEGEVEEIEVKMKKVSFYITNIKDKSIEFRKTSGGTDHTLSISTLEKMYDEENTGEIQGLSSYYGPLLQDLLEIGKLDEVEEVKLKNYVIIIDEINRANISRVFGELITLIEKDKRSNGKIPIRATLPSGDKFMVPSNLYIIGTMNTADKSIALLDIALRRRFEFVPMYPKYQIEDYSIHDVEILKKMNTEIISRKGHDFTIGHSYFMGDDYSLENTINNKVVPLLLEYFMNDYDEVKKILKAVNLQIDGWPMKLILND